MLTFDRACQHVNGDLLPNDNPDQRAACSGFQGWDPYFAPASFPRC
jgi:hypothetical protein